MRDECIELSLTCKLSFSSIAYRVKLPSLLTYFLTRFPLVVAISVGCIGLPNALASWSGQKT
jgi:hypothetical protein